MLDEDEALIAVLERGPRIAEKLVRQHLFIARPCDSGTRERIHAAVVAYARALLGRGFPLRVEPPRPGGLTDDQFREFCATVREQVRQAALDSMVAEFARFETVKTLGPGAT